MLSYKKSHAAKSDPVKEILSRREARQNQTGLSLYTKRNTLEEVLAPAIKQVRGTNTYSSTKKSTIPRFADLSAVRQKVHKRLKAGTNAAGKQEYSEKRRGLAPFGSLEDCAEDHVVNLTFPPAASRSFQAVGDRSLNRSHNGFSGNSNSDLRSAELNLNPFGYMRRTQAFEPTQMNYVVEWPKTWPFKIMSFQHRNRTEHRRDIRTKSAKLKVSQSLERDEGNAPAKSAYEGGESEGPLKQSLCKPPLPRLPEGCVKGNLHRSSGSTRESNGESVTEAPREKESTDPARPRISREVEIRVASSSVAESTYITLQNDSTVQDSGVNPEPAEPPAQLITAPPSSPCLSSVVQKHDKEEERIDEGEEVDRSQAPVRDIGSESALNTQQNT